VRHALQAPKLAKSVLELPTFDYVIGVASPKPAPQPGILGNRRDRASIDRNVLIGTVCAASGDRMLAARFDWLRNDRRMHGKRRWLGKTERGSWARAA
jgi:hypothetical protein